MRYKIVFSLILILAIILRFWKLGSLPSGLTWDEAAIGYNAYGILTVHRDEWLARMPLVFMSFGDFKAPLLIYAVAFSEIFFGQTPFAVRLPVALAGVWLVVVSYLIAKQLTREKILALFVMFFVCISPWAIHFSRIAFESMLAASLFATSVWLFFVGLQKGKWLIGSAALAVLSIYAYHSAKIVVPLSALLLFALHRKNLTLHKKWLIKSALIAAVLIAPLLYASVFGKANARALSTTIFSNPNPITTFATHYLTHFDPSYLVLGHELTYRHSDFIDGIFAPLELILVIAGVIVVCVDSRFKNMKFVPAIFLISVLPAALGIDVPHANRALLGLPWAQILAGIGVFELWRRRNHFSRAGVALVILFSLFSLGTYIGNYSKVYTSQLALNEFGYGYDALLPWLRTQEHTVDHVYFTNHYSQAYIYLLFFKQLNPIEYRQGGLANYTISDHPWEDAKDKKDVLVVGAKGQIPPNANIIKTIDYPDGETAFQVARL
ncbi:MAG TPA: glycosyltransferase family 39 protein [Patescibacteria group bacterium]|nr:glycosyltransferase family 39 protein [Patescibacteria group bacterium]